MKKESVSQYEKMTNTPVGKLIITLSIPTVFTMLITNIYNVVDTAFVGTLGNSPSGAIGVVFGFMSILQAIGFLFGQGAGSILSRKLGSKDIDEANIVASSGFYTAFAISLIAEILCFIFLDDLVILLGSTPTIAPYAKVYISFILLAAPSVTTSFTLNNLLRYEGHAALGMIGMLSGALINMLGDWLFISVLGMGIEGAGLSTAISQFLSFCILLTMFIRKKTQCDISFRIIEKNLKLYADIVTTGLPSLLRQALSSVTTIILNQQAALYGGDAGVAAMSIVARISFLAFSVAIGIGQGFQPVSGFNYGAKKYDRVKKGYRFTVVFAEILIIVLSFITFFYAEELVRRLRDDADVIRIGVRALRLQSLAHVFLPFCMATEMLLQSTGQKLDCSILSSLRNGLFFIPTLLILSYYRGISGVQEAQPLAFVLSLIPTIYYALKFMKKMNQNQL